MDVDSRMTTESDSDSDAAAQGGGFGSETSSASPSAPGTPTAMGAGGGATPIAASATAASATAVMDGEGSPGYVGPWLILFGGATALEGNSATPPSPAGSAGIRNAFQLSPALVSYGFVDGLVC
ncbi:hypothetical protein GUJ93_ZPchr0001g30554 [Zizania palustris]|uniref:Uncharacterized protein n=1 Tax=Zizania palustris TaxID=103762 RepID=A0A8J5RNL2_ZIZPA|nr:hypothetical protein GUJ93_ZPchr0001g30554 [Zizania palustris]